MKNLLLQASLLLVAGTLSAQLFVKPNGTVDSYVYVNDQVLYVKEGIDLKLNTNNVETKASIYLRGNSQLMQGNDVSSNTGDGLLSVWQKGWGNAYSYNYWASPVGHADNATTGNANFGITKYHDVKFSSPGVLHKTYSEPANHTFNVNGTTNPLVISRRWIYTLRATTGYSNWFYIGESTNLLPGEGFSMKGTSTNPGPTHHQLYDFRGRPNSGNINVGVATVGGVGQWTLTGNPYPSALDLTDFLLDPDNFTIEATVWYYDKNKTIDSHNITQIQSGYATWQPGADGNGNFTAATYLTYDGLGNQVGNTNTTGAITDPGRYAPIGQGFMVRGDVGYLSGAGSATFKNSMRVYEPNMATNVKAAQPSGIRLMTTVNNTYVRDMLLMFSGNSTMGADRGMDSRHPHVLSKDAYWPIQGSPFKFVIQTLPFAETSYIPIVLVADAQTTFKMKVSEFINFNRKVFLYDKLLDTFTPLWTEATLTLPAGNYGKRFYITFGNYNKEDIAAADAARSDANLRMDFFQNNRVKQLEVKNPDVMNIKNASVYDMRGRLVISENNLGAQQQYTFSTSGLSDGIYIVKLTTTDDIVIDYKVNVINKN